MTTDWSECDLVESVAGKVDGKLVVKGTRIPADTILTDEELGATAEETQESFPSLSLDTIRSIRAYGHSHKPQLKPGAPSFAFSQRRAEDPEAEFGPKPAHRARVWGLSLVYPSHREAAV
jgi:uncharacterized protein (DUF433 family)